MTASENVKHAFDTGLAKVLRGTDNGATKLTAEQIQEIRRTYRRRDKDYGINALAKKYNVGINTIWRIVKNLTFKNIE